MVVDDSSLLHGGKYDPVKAHEYYLRNRHLKGRSPSSPQSSGGRTITKKEFQNKASGNEGKYKKTQVKSYNKEEARQHAQERLNQLEARLKRLRLLLAKKIEQAQARSGVGKNSQEKQASESKAKSSDDSKKSSSSKSGGSSDKKTAAEKREDAKRHRENYEKQKDNSPQLSVQQEIAQVQKQIREVEQALRNIAKKARENHAGKSQTARNGR